MRKRDLYTLGRNHRKVCSLIQNLVSIIIPTYNRRDIVVTAIKSALNQSYRHTEIIVVDDGSTDNTGITIDSLNAGIKFIYQDNKGASAARNLGIKSSAGEYIAFLDSDDVWAVDKLKMQIECFTNHPDIGLVDTNVQFEDSHGNTVPSSKNFNLMKPHENCMRDLPNVFKFPYLGTSTVMIKKSVLDDVGGFDVNLKTAEDLDLWLRIARKYKIYYLANKLVTVRHVDSGLSTDPCSYEDNLTVIRNFLRSDVNFRKTQKKLIREVYSLVHMRYGRALLAINNVGKARSNLFKSLLYKPCIFSARLFLMTCFPKSLITLITKTRTEKTL